MCRRAQHLQRNETPRGSNHLRDGAPVQEMQSAVTSRGGGGCWSCRPWYCLSEVPDIKSVCDAFRTSKFTQGRGNTLTATSELAYRGIRRAPSARENPR